MGFSSRSKFEFFLTSFFFKRAYDDSGDNVIIESESRPSPSLVQLPVGIVVGSVKEKLPVTEYGCRKKEGGGGDSTSCAICLKWMREGDQVRELWNCCHSFHKECLDCWIDQAHVTCPLCRSKLLPGDLNGGEFVSGGDPWRRERLIYLFGEDFVFQ